MAATLPFSLSALRSHAIFVPPASSSTDDGWEVVEATQDEGLPAPKNSRIALRDKDIIVAFGKEIRMTSLTGPGWEINGGTVGGYKTLKSPHLTFNIHSLILNPTGRLLAVVGHHQLVILVLPRSGFASSVGGDVACHSFPIDEYQHSPSSDNAITKVRWHEWGESGNSLWVLTADGQLFEYDVLRPQDPAQSFNFLADKSKGSKFSAIDPLSQYATSFSFSHGTVDFGPLMVYALMANGDVYVMGPVLPLHAEVPASYLQSLQAWASERQRRLKADGRPGAEHASRVGRAGLQVQWVDALVRQAEKADEDAPSPAQSTSHRRGFGLRDPSPEPSPERAPARPGFVLVHPPHLTASGSPAPGVHRPLLRQGPVLFDPAPQEVGNGDEIDEQIASDIVIFPAVPAEADSAPSETVEPINVVGIAWSGGRVDIGIEEAAPEPRWLSSRDPADTELCVPIVESVLASYPPLEPEALATNAPRFVQDPIHRDVFYVQSALSVDTVSVAPWIGKLMDGSELPPSDVAALVVASPSKPVIGAATFCNITLGYGLLALAAGGHLVAVEMDMRVADRDPLPVPEPEAPKKEESHQLLTKAFNPALDGKPSNPLAAIRKLPDSGKELKEIGPQHLRALADAAAQVNARAEAIRSASAKVEARVELQAQEYARQLALLRESQSALESIQDSSDAQVERTARLVDAQASLSARLDAVLNAMLAEYRPQIGEVERKWFDELERIKARIAGRKGIAHRAKILHEQLDVVRPMAQRRKEQHEAAYGHRQLRPLEQAIGERSDELARIMRRMDALSVRVEGADEE